MEDSNWLLIRLPNEIQYYVARYIDLTCLGALLLTSKQTNTLFQHDLAFQSIVRTATTYSIFKIFLKYYYNIYYAKSISVTISESDLTINFHLKRMAVHHSKFRRPVRVVYNDHLAFVSP
jgi:hypothetical protein